MAGIIVHMNPFDEAGEQWATYIERFEHYILTNEISDRKKVPVLFSVLGSKTYGLLRSLVAPDKLGDVGFDEILRVLQAHFAPKPLVIVEIPISQVKSGGWGNSDTVCRASANDSFLKVGNYDDKEDKTPPPQKKINSYYNMAGSAPPTDSCITRIAK
ncbi:hypothetical protein F2P79_016335 [Pimephales promelas]|nr:hypothetical protein F2P79_016335 [Pimephales promelas]